uniref:host specificity protein J n=1 Tax=Rodentibacter haemolyticus TaxID=2778911 RepID=UPI0038CD9CFE
MDRPTDPVWTYTNANVENGEFTYAYSAKKARHNAIQVEYADKDNAYEKTIEYVSDDESIRKNGLNVKKVTAFGCTSRGQAHRTGLWLLQTEKLETKTVTFTVGSEGLMHIPGDIIKVADVDYAGTNIGGRVLAINGKKVELDREIEINGQSYFTYINSEAKHQDIKILNVSGKTITLDREPVGLNQYGVWSLSTQQINSQLFRALTVKEEEKGKYTITALQHEPQKEAIVDNGAKFEPKETTLHRYPKLTHLDVATGFDGKLYIKAETTGGEGVVTYDIKLLKEGRLYLFKQGLKSPDLTLDDLPNGDYQLIIYAKNGKGQLISEKSQTFTVDKPPAPTGVRITGGLGEITLEWDWVNDITQTEIFASETNKFAEAKRLAKVNARTYNHAVGAKQVHYYWLRHTRGQNNGPFYQEEGLRGESAVDIDEELKLLNEKLGQNIINEVFGTAMPARQLEMIKTVDRLNVDEYIGYHQVHNTVDGKLYVWDGHQYKVNDVDISRIPVENIVGKMTSDQIESLNTAKLIGKVNSGQIQNINANQINGSIQANQLAAGAVTTAKLAAGAVVADKLAANSVSAGALQAGAVRANHVAAGELTADKLAIGLGGNLLYNPIFANNGNGWFMYVDTQNIDNNGWRFDNETGIYQGGAYLPTELKFRWQLERKNLNVGNVRLGGLYQDIKLVKNKYYCFSAYVGGHRSFTDLNIEQGAVQIIKRSWGGRGVNGGYGNNNIDTGIENDRRIFVIFKATGDNANYRLIINMWAEGANQSPFIAIRRPMLEECTEHTKSPSPWQNAGVTAIHGGSIVTQSITTQQIAANAITANQLAAGVVAARHIAANSINSGHIVSKSISVDKLNVSHLSAISADLGDIRGGSININNRFKVGRDGVMEMRANQGNVGLVINNNQIIVYDIQGRPRLKIGKLR